MELYLASHAIDHELFAFPISGIVFHTTLPSSASVSAPACRGSVQALSFQTPYATTVARQTIHDGIPHYRALDICCMCFMVRKLTSRNLWTQLARHPSSALSSVELRMELVTHFFQQTSVRACVSAMRRRLEWVERAASTGEALTTLYLRNLRLVGNELPQLRLVLVVELV